MKEQSNASYKQSFVIRFLKRPLLDITGAPNREILEVAEETVREVKIPDSKDELSRENMRKLVALLSNTSKDHRLSLKDRLLRIKRSLGQGINKTNHLLGKYRGTHPRMNRWRMNARAALNIKRRQMKAVKTLIFLIEESFPEDLVQS